MSLLRQGGPRESLSWCGDTSLRLLTQNGVQLGDQRAAAGVPGERADCGCVRAPAAALRSGQGGAGCRGGAVPAGRFPRRYHSLVLVVADRLCNLLVACQPSIHAIFSRALQARL